MGLSEKVVKIRIIASAEMAADISFALVGCLEAKGVEFIEWSEPREDRNELGMTRTYLVGLLSNFKAEEVLDESVI